MNKKSALFSILLSITSGCSTPHEQTLLDIEVESAFTLPDQEVKALLSNVPINVSQTDSPLPLLSFLWPGYSGQNQLVSASKSGTYVTGIAIFDGIQDDSVKGIRFDVTLTKTSSNAWDILSIEKSWRCWEGRGHRNFSAEPCS